MSDPSSSAAQFANYQEYNKALRTWFVTFGLGAPSLFLINQNLDSTLKSAGVLTWVVALYLIGCAAQIVVAMLNKFAAWHAYDAIAYPRPTKSLRHRCFNRIENEFRIDMAADILTAAAFVIATVIVFVTFAL